MNNKELLMMSALRNILFETDLDTSYLDNLRLTKRVKDILLQDREFYAETNAHVNAGGEVEYLIEKTPVVDEIELTKEELNYFYKRAIQYSLPRQSYILIAAEEWTSEYLEDLTDKTKREVIELIENARIPDSYDEVTWRRIRKRLEESFRDKKQEDNVPAIEELKKIVNLEDIEKITLGDLELDIERTLELMGETPLEEVLDNLEIWCENFKLVIVCDDKDGHDLHHNDCHFNKIHLKQETTFKVTPDTLKTTWKDPVTGKDLPTRKRKERGGSVSYLYERGSMIYLYENHHGILYLSSEDNPDVNRCPICGDRDHKREAYNVEDSEDARHLVYNLFAVVLEERHSRDTWLKLLNDLKELYDEIYFEFETTKEEWEDSIEYYKDELPEKLEEYLKNE